MHNQTVFWGIVLLMVIPYNQFVIQAAKKNKNFIKCPDLELKNGRVKIRLARRLAKFSCKKRFHLLGNSFSICKEGEWGFPKPVCAAPGCKVPDSTESMAAIASQAGILMTYHCLVPTRTASKTVFCDGKMWSSGPPDCNGSGNTNSSGEESRETEEEQTSSPQEKPQTTTRKTENSTTLTTATTSASTIKMTPSTVPLVTTSATTTTLSTTAFTTTSTKKTTPATTTTLEPYTTWGRTKRKPTMTSSKALVTTKKPLSTSSVSPGVTSSSRPTTSATTSVPSTMASSTVVEIVPITQTTESVLTPKPTEFVNTKEPKPFQNTKPNEPFPATAPHHQDKGDSSSQQGALSKPEVHWSVSVGMVSGIVAAGICSLGVLFAVVCFVKRRRHVTTYNQSRDWDFVQPILVQLQSPSETTRDC